MALKRCKQCGLLKETKDFRQYSYTKNEDREPAFFRVCKDCEAINATYRRARELYDAGGLSPEESSRNADIIMRISKLYETLEAKGLQVPNYGARKKVSPVDQVDKLLAFYGQKPEEQARQSTVAVDHEVELPEDLNDWLTQDMNLWIEKGLSPEYLQEVVYEALKNKYRPQLGYDPERGLPIYDDTYKEALNNILKRFDDYEDSMEGGEVE